MKMTGLLMLALLSVAAAQGYGGEEIVTLLYTINGIVTLEGHRCIFRNGELQMTGALLEIGQQGEFIIQAGFATSESGQSIQISGGRVTAISLPSTDRQAISNALARSGVTVDQFFQQTGTIPPMNGVFELISGVIVANGVYYEVDVGVIIVLSVVEVQPTGPGGVQPTVDLAVEQTQTIFVTEAYQTTTVVEPVTLTKFSTRDVIVTVNSPVYYSVDATVTNFVKQTVNVPEDQVLRSPAAVGLIVNTMTVTDLSVVVVRDTSTNFLVQTIVGDAVVQLEHVETSFTFSTVTVDVPVTSSIVQTITRTSVATVAVTQTVGSTIYSTRTVVVTQAPATQTQGY